MNSKITEHQWARRSSFCIPAGPGGGSNEYQHLGRACRGRLESCPRCLALVSEWRLETARLHLRHVSLDDADLLLAVWNDPAFVRNVGDRGVRSIEEAQEAMKTGALKLYADYGYGPYAMVRNSDGARMGICGLFKRDNLDSPDIGFGVLPDYCGKGYAGEASFAVLAHARDDLKLKELTAIVSPDNSPSIGLIEKLGLAFVKMITMPGEDKEICLYSKELRQE